MMVAAAMMLDSASVPRRRANGNRAYQRTAATTALDVLLTRS